MRVVGPKGTGAELLDGLAKKATAAGALDLVVLRHDYGSEGDRVGAFIEIPSAACVLAVAAGSSTVSDLDLFAFEDDGTAFGADESPRAEGAVMLCPPHPGRLYVSARLVSGAGGVTVGAMEVPVARSREVAAAVGAHSLGDETGQLEAWPGLEGRVLGRRRALGSRWEDVRRASLPLHPRAWTRTTIEVRPDRCIDVLATPSEEVSSLELTAEDDAGRVIARGEANGRDRGMVLCSQFGDTVTLALRPRGGPGSSALVIGLSREGAERELEKTTRIDRASATRDLSQERDTLRQLLARTDLGPAKEVGVGTARVGTRTEMAVKTEEGCSRVDVVAGSPLGAITAALWDGEGALLGEDRGGSRATLYACGASRELRIDVEAGSRPGPFAVETRVFAHSEKELIKHPIAAARLLGRIFGDEARAPSRLEKIRAIHLDHGTRFDLPVEIAEHTCLDLSVALDGPGSGVELRLIDGAEDKISRGQSSTSDRVCADSSKKSLKVELRLSAGATDALFLAREPDD